VALAAGDHPAASPEFEAYEGNFYFFSDTPNTLYLMGDIGKDVSSRAGIAFRRAIRNHDIDKLILMSGGGRVDIGLEYAAIIRDKEIAVYVPKDTYCYSACSYMFFGGVGRYAEGEVGIHQFYANTDRQDKVSRVQQSAQFGVSDIIAILNSFGVSPTLYEHMFSTVSADMYILTDEELSELGVESKQAWHEEVDSLLERIAEAAALREVANEEVQPTPEPTPEPIPEPTPKPTVTPSQPSRDDEQRKTIARVQTLLNEHNCGAGSPDGIAGERTKSAINLFRQAALLRVSIEDEQFIEKLITALETTRRPACRSVEPTGSALSQFGKTLEGEWAVLFKCEDRTVRGQMFVPKVNPQYKGKDSYGVAFLGVDGVWARGSLQEFGSNNRSKRLRVEFGIIGILRAYTENAVVSESRDEIRVLDQGFSGNSNFKDCRMDAYRVKID